MQSLGVTWELKESGSRKPLSTLLGKMILTWSALQSAVKQLLAQFQ